MNILVAMSGGVDSSMTAKMLVEAGHSVVGAYAKLHNQKVGYHEHNIANVKMVAEFLGIPYRVEDFTGEFNEEVFMPFVESYKQGLTPNPCAICNRKIKFGALWRVAQSIGAEKIATGHYARIKNGRIYEATDPSKDQSYFLSNIEPEMVQRLVFPLGEMFKKDVKEMAAKVPQIASLATQKESSEICFVPNEYTDVLRNFFDIDKAGAVKDAQGNIVGTHGGYAKYTVGKRRGFSVNGAHEPHFVLKTNPETNEIIVGKADELVCFGFSTTNFNDFVGQSEFDALVKVRYRSAKIPCRVKREGSGVKVELSQNARAVASGQLAVFYDNEGGVLGSGFIK